MKHGTIVSIIILSSIIAISATKGKSSSGAPASHTGAPDEQTCATGGCHDDNPLNSGTAKFQISVGDGITAIDPGQTYRVKIQIWDENVTRFGFQIVALSAEKNENAGEFIIKDTQRTQLAKNTYKLQERQYVTYTFNGTDAVSLGLGEWIVDWKAPEILNSSIIMYASAVSANDDMHDTGDMVYTNKLILTTK